MEGLLSFSGPIVSDRRPLLQNLTGFRTTSDTLAALIEERYGSRNKFLGETGVDETLLNCIFSGRNDFPIESLKKVLGPLHATLVVRSDEDLKAIASPEEACRMLETALQ